MPIEVCSGNKLVINVLSITKAVSNALIEYLLNKLYHKV